MKIHVVRHGQTDYNVRNVFQGHKDIPLNEVGKKQGEELAEKFRNISIDVILSSPLTRAKQTAQYISDIKNIPIAIEPGLIERSFGDMEGKPNREDCNIHMLVDYDKNYNICNVEQIQTLIARAGKCIDDIIKRYEGKNVVLVTHGGVIEAIECHINGLPKNKDILSLSLKNGEIRTYDIQHEKNIDEER